MIGGQTSSVDEQKGELEFLEVKRRESDVEMGGRKEGSVDLQREGEALRLEGEAAEVDEGSESGRRQL